MKKICFVTDSIFSIGGVQRVTAVIAGALSKDYDVTIITFDDPDKKDLSLYNLKDYPIKYVFTHYPQVGKWKELLFKTYSYLYKNLLCHNSPPSIPIQVHRAFLWEKYTHKPIFSANLA